MSTHARIQETTFYEQLQALPGLDMRDKRGQRHNLPFVLLMLILALFRNRDGNLSSIHRCMENMHQQVIKYLQMNADVKPISRAHLPRLLQKVNLEIFEPFLIDQCKIKLDADKKNGFR